MRLLFGLIFVGIGGYIAWEAHSILSWDLFQAASVYAQNELITPSTLEVFNSFLTDVLYNAFQVETVGEMDRYLSIARIAGVVIAVFGLALTFKAVKK